MPKSITILGATGSIGDSTLDLVRQHPDRFTVASLTAYSNVDKLVALAKEFKPKSVVIANDLYFYQVKDALAGSGIDVLAGAEAVAQIASEPCDLLVAAIVGAAGLKPVLAAIRAGHVIALANKEALVCAGDLVMQEVQQHGATILPIDSEHNAIYQVFDFKHPGTIDHLTLTASGGPFLTRDVSTFSAITPKEAVAHPNWDMGAKISVDSATMMNKGLELIEAYHLFPVGVDQLDVVIHPQSVIHSTVTYKDGSVLAQLGSPDMRIPISYCMDYPDRITTGAKKLDLATIGQLTFIKPDFDRFPCLKLAIEAMHQGGAAPLLLNAANEVAVASFLEGRVAFTDIARIVASVLAQMDMKAPHSIATLLDMDTDCRKKAQAVIEKI